MLSLGLVAFTAPWVLAALAALPIIWWLLRVTPPAPRLVRFPAIRLLFRLREKEDTPAKTPWWLLLLRLLVVTLAMGPMGPLSRLVLPAAGSLLTYGHVGAPTAAGQLPVRELAALLARLGLR